LDPVGLGLPGSGSGERCAGEERSEPGGRATRGAGGTLRAAAAAGHRAALSPELVAEAVNRARVRSAVGPLPGGGRSSDEVIDGLLAGASSEEEIAGPGGPLARLTKRLVERAMEVELTEHLGYEPRPGAGWRDGQRAQRLDTEDAGHRPGAGPDRHPKGSRRQH
jgi:hypothetical protein